MIEDYIEYVSLKRDELGGHAICPFAKPHLDKIEIIESKNFQEDAFNCFHTEEHPALWLIYGDAKQFDKKWLEEFCNNHQEFAKAKDLWLIWDHPDQINKINGIKTSNDKYAILFIQPLSEIKKYSNKLHKTNYYSFWSEDYYNEVVGSRSSYENLSDDCFEEMLVHKLFKKNKNK
tara:strand:+ start:6255 stop:6782 length:528 start_codon:yes stop_codon:yes gene_type:complete